MIINSDLNNEEPLVSISCITYNHVNYIKDAIEGFLMQKTSFKFEVLIHDDASNDGTEEIIRDYEAKYPNIIKPLYETENQWIKGRIGSAIFNFPRAHGKYIALCEGDDYWTDPYKLQKQVDFLENNADYGLVCTDFNILHQTNGKIENSLFKNQPQRFPVYTKLEDFLLAAGFMAPCTWLCRKEFLPSFSKNHSDSSFAWLLQVFAKSRVCVIPDTTTVYRKLPESASHSKSINVRYSREVGILTTQLDFIKDYKLSDTLKLKVLKRHYHTILPSLVALGENEELKLANYYLSKEERSFRDKCLFFLARFHLGGKLVNLYYWFRDNTK